MSLSWQLEANNPEQSTDWKALWEFDEEQQETYQELVIELNQINSKSFFTYWPILLQSTRIKSWFGVRLAIYKKN